MRKTLGLFSLSLQSIWRRKLKKKFKSNIGFNNKKKLENTNGLIKFEERYLQRFRKFRKSNIYSTNTSLFDRRPFHNYYLYKLKILNK